MKTKNFVVMALLSSSLLFSCGTDEAEPVQTLVGNATTLATYGSQTITLSITDSYGNEKSTFKDTITKDDVYFRYRLVGRSVESLTYIDSSSVSLTLGGDCRKSSGDIDSASIVIKGDAFANGAAAFAEFLISDPKPKVYSFGSVTGKTASTKTYRASYYFIGGDITEATTSTITCDASSGTYSVTKSDEYASISLADYSSSLDLPKLTFTKDSNSLGLEFTVTFGSDK